MTHAVPRIRWLVSIAAIVSFVGIGLIVASAGGADEAEDITSLPILDTFARTESPLAGPGGQWAALQWASSSGGTETGAVTETGWRAVDAHPTINGAFWKTKFSDIGNGDAVSVKMTEAPNSKGRYVALWLNMPEPEVTKSGYQLSWTWVSEPEKAASYDIVLAKWVSGTKTVLASKTATSLSIGTTLALSYNDGVVSAWTGTQTAVTKLLSANDAWFSSGYAGIEAAGNSSRSQNFRAGSLEGEVPEACVLGTQFYGGLCWDNASNSTAETIMQASTHCGNEGGELPDPFALATFAAQSGVFLDSGGEWSSDVTSFTAKNAYAAAVIYDNGEVDSAVASGKRRYRCVYPAAS
jgi:hypothetical protein